LPCTIQAINEVRCAQAITLTPVQQLRELRLRISTTELGYIRHDLKYAPAGSDKEQQLLARARQAGLSGTDQELRAFLESATALSAELVCRGQRFAGIFCDVEGTLLKVDGTVNSRVYGLLQEAATIGRAVTVWTGSDPAYIAGKLQQAGLTYQVVRKGDFAGATVEEAIDDNLDALREEYKITAERERDARTLAL
jgi:hypothetical protein